MNEPDPSAAGPHADRGLRRKRNLVAVYSWVLAVVVSVGLVLTYTVSFVPDSPKPSESGVTIHTDTPVPETYELILTVFTLVALAGGLGGVLYNFRGLVGHPVRPVDHEDVEKFDPAMGFTYYLQPWTGAVCGILSLLAIQFLASGLGITQKNGFSFGLFASPGSRLGLGALALLSGYATKEFLDKVKDIIKTLFGNNGAAP